MKKYLIINVFLIVIFNLNSINIVPLNELFSKEEITKIIKGEIISRMYLKGNPENVNTHLKMNIPKTQFTNEDFSVYEMIVDEKAFIPYKITDESKLKFFNILTSYSKLNGMEYYSRRIAENQKLILNSFKITAPNDKKPLPDFQYKNIQQNTENYFLQQDNKFGKLVFKSSINNKENDFVMINTCMQPILPINKKEDYKIITFFLYDKEAEGFYYYTISAMRIRIGIEFVTKKTNATLFSNRLRATTIHLAKLLGLDWSKKINPWNEAMLLDGKYRTY